MSYTEINRRITEMIGGAVCGGGGQSLTREECARILLVDGEVVWVRNTDPKNLNLYPEGFERLLVFDQEGRHFFLESSQICEVLCVDKA